jgi:CheY-like chemotaxis protein
MISNPTESRPHNHRLASTTKGTADANGGHAEPGGTAVPQSEEPRPEGQPAGPPPAPTTVLLVEDEPSVRRLALRSLQKGGYAVLEAGNGQEALAVVAGHRGPVHLLVTDMMMPVMGGRELARRLRAASPGLRVLFVSGYTGAGAAIDDGCHFLGKPFTQARLVQRVREVLQGPREHAP